MTPYSIDWIALVMSWDIIEINPMPTHTAAPWVGVKVTLEVEAVEGKRCSRVVEVTIYVNRWILGVGVVEIQ
jgi:hypothetical protein